MKKTVLLMGVLAAFHAPVSADVTIPVMEKATFYDGYLVGNIPDDAPDQGYLRLYTYLNSARLTDEQLDRIGDHLTLDVELFPFCDNYDRIGSVNLAFVPKGSEAYTVAYDETDPMRIEVARFITPFMNKNRNPKQVPYLFQVDNLSAVLRSASLRRDYDIWLELEIFGVPYAAQSQIIGCRDCNHVFDASVSLVTDDTPAPASETCVFIPIVTRRSDWRADRGINNYNEACTDRLGETVKTYSFTLPASLPQGRVVIMMSNHGADTNGEEYERRMHYASLDGAEALQWKPGRTSCEPFRRYNTQTNGIYGTREQTDEWWQSWNNWCPGAPIPYQSFLTGPLSAGTHTVTIEVPDAVFYGNDGFFPVSMYFQADSGGAAVTAPRDYDSPSGIAPVDADDYRSQAFVEGGVLSVTCPDGIDRLDLYNPDGHMAATLGAGSATAAALDVSALEAGVYILVVRTSVRAEARKIVL